MEATDTDTKESSGWRPRSGQFTRPIRGRMLAGVAQGIAYRLDIHPWIPRVFFIVTAFMGGFGVVLYAACWAFVRSENERESPAERLFSGASTPMSWIGIGLLVVAGIIVLSNLTFLDAEVVWAGAFLAVGLLLYMGYLPFGSGDHATDKAADSNDGAEAMTTSDTHEVETEPSRTSSDDSPSGGVTPPPPSPTPTPPDLPPAKSRDSSILGQLTIGVMLVGLGVLALLDNIATLPIDANLRHYMALAVTILGIGLIVGSIAGRARWLILVGVILIPTLMFSPVFEYDWTDDGFNRFVQPLTFDELESEYSIETGSLVIDLTELNWSGQTVDLRATADVGNIELRVPADVGIEGVATADVGRVAGPDGESFGFGDPSVSLDYPGGDGTVVVDMEVDVGNIQVVNR